MADPISIASGLVALAAFALRSSRSLFQTIESFRSNHRTIRELKEELEALDSVLQSLGTTANNHDGLAGLNLPLLRCGNACKDFEAVVVKCTAHSGKPRTSFRDWAKMKYMGDDIVGFKNMLAGYKSTISIALGDATLQVIRTATVTADVLKEYKEMIINTTSDLEDHLLEIDNKLQCLSSQSSRMPNEHSDDRERIQEERDSTRQCLRICAQVSQHIKQVQPNTFEEISTASSEHGEMVTTLRSRTSAKRVTTRALEECKEKLSTTTRELEEHLEGIYEIIESSSQGKKMTGEQKVEQERMQAEKDSIKRCLAICAEASQQADEVPANTLEDISAAQDAHQLIVATFGDLISAKRVTAGVRSTQWLGQMSDVTLQQLSRDRGCTALEKAMESQHGASGTFEERYGTGQKLEAAYLTSRRRSLPAEKVC